MSGFCCLCTKSYDGHGNNPEPVASGDERCCNACNYQVVLPARVAAIFANPGNADEEMKKLIDKGGSL